MVVCVIIYVECGEMISGSVRWFSLRKGYGFIVAEDFGTDVFIHISELHRSGIKFLIPGKKVDFEVQLDRGRLMAANLRLR